MYAQEMEQALKLSVPVLSFEGYVVLRCQASAQKYVVLSLWQNRSIVVCCVVGSSRSVFYFSSGMWRRCFIYNMYMSFYFKRTLANQLFYIALEQYFFFEQGFGQFGYITFFSVSSCSVRL